MASKHPWTAIPATRSSARLLQTRLRLVVGLIVLAVVMGPLALFVALGSKAHSTTTVSSSDALATGQAAIVAQAFLNDQPVSVPAATGVDLTWGSSSTVTEPLAYSFFTHANTHQDVLNGRNYQIDTFNFLSDGKEMSVSVTSLIDDTSHPQVAAMPALQAVDATSQASGPDSHPLDFSDVKGYAAGPPNSTTTGRVQNWATAFAADDSAALLVLTNDPTTGDTYHGLGGFTATSVQVQGYVSTGTLTFPTLKNPTFTDTAYLRVRVVFQSSSAKKYTVSNDYDLLVSDVGSAQPHILAWGGAGSVPLTPYSNSNHH